MSPTPTPTPDIQPSLPSANSRPKPVAFGWLISKALGKASLGLLNPKMWLLSVLPFLIACAIWGGLAYFAWEPANNIARSIIGAFWLPDWFTGLFPAGLGNWFDGLRAVWAPLMVMMLLIPGVILTVFVLVGLLGTTVVANHVAKQYGLAPEAKTTTARSINWLGSVWHSAWVLSVLVVLWLLTLPLWLIPGIGFIVPLMLLAWANTRLFTRDVLADYATAPEIANLKATHGATLFTLGLLASLPACIPSFLWLFGGMTIVALPLLGAIAVWVYVMVFIATALLFSHYVMAALKAQRDAAMPLHPAATPIKLSTAETATEAEPPAPESTVFDAQKGLIASANPLLPH